MFTVVVSLFSSIWQGIRGRLALQAENLALRHQLLVLQRAGRGHKLRLKTPDRLLWVWLSRLWSEWRSALIIVKLETVIAWHRRGFRLYWSGKSSAHSGSAQCVVRGHRSDPEDEFGQSSVGGTAHPRGASETWLRAVRGYRGQIHGAASEAAVTDLAHLPNKPCEGSGLI
jgi:hypothetical protein